MWVVEVWRGAGMEGDCVEGAGGSVEGCRCGSESVEGRRWEECGRVQVGVWRDEVGGVWKDAGGSVEGCRWEECGRMQVGVWREQVGGVWKDAGGSVEGCRCGSESVEGRTVGGSVEGCRWECGGTQVGVWRDVGVEVRVWRDKVWGCR